jgi:chromosome segregation ATPase
MAKKKAQEVQESFHELVKQGDNALASVGGKEDALGIYKEALNVNDAKLNTGFAELKSKVETLAEELKAEKAKAKENAKLSDQRAEAMATVEKASKDFIGKLTSLDKELEKLLKAYDQAGYTTRRVTVARASITKLLKLFK